MGTHINIDALLARADELMETAPGRVVVHRISQIEDVRIRREAEAALSDHERSELDRVRLQLMERLDRCAAAVAPRKAERKGRLRALISSPGSLASKANRSKGEYDHMVQQAGGPSGLPAPQGLLDAAEAWAIADLVSDRIDTDLSVLRRPWEEASIEPES